LARILSEKGWFNPVLPKSRKIINNPTFEELRSLVAEMPQSEMTNCRNYNVNTRITARSAESTFIVSDKDIGQKRISRKDYEQIEKLQDEYVAKKEMILIDGCIGPDADSQVGCRLLVDKENANIAAMQQQLYFSLAVKTNHELTVIDTPNLTIQGYPNDCLITVDLDTYTTRIIGSDYFGESKKGGLRMWNMSIIPVGLDYMQAAKCIRMSMVKRN
jgi:phosphoenolpyruvate carboxykinase (ATP)